MTATKLPRRVIALAAVAMTLSAAVRVAAQQGPPTSAEDPAGRDKWWWGTRLGPNPEAAMAAYGRQMELAASQHRVVHGAITSSSVAGFAGSTWRPLGPIGFYGNATFGSGSQVDAGRSTAVAVSPTDSRTVYIGTIGGVWKTTNAGGTWSPLTDDQCSMVIGSVKIDPKNPSIVYASTGEATAGSYQFKFSGGGCGILRTTDGGTSSWTRIGNATLPTSYGSQAGIRDVFIDPATAGSASSTMLLAATMGGLYRSTNSGSSWSRVLTGRAAPVVSLPAQPTKFFSAAGSNGVTTIPAASRGIYSSTDGGNTWTILPALPGVDNTLMERVELATSAAKPNSVWAAVENGTDQSLLGLFRWDDDTQKWTSLSTTTLYAADSRQNLGNVTGSMLLLAVDPADANRIYIAGNRAYRSTDGGATWSTMAKEIHDDWRGFTIDPSNVNNLWAATDGGIYESTDHGDTWTSRSFGLNISQFFSGISADSKGLVIMGGTQDDGSHVYGGSAIWDGFFGGDGGYTAINQQKPSVQYATAQWNPAIGGLDLTRRSGTSFTNRLSTGINSSEPATFLPPVIIDPNDGNTLYTATDRIYRSTNEGTLWTPITGSLTAQRFSTSAVISIALSSDSKTLWAASDDERVWVSQNNGATFTEVSPPKTTWFLSRVIIDPADSKHVLVLTSGYGVPHVRETTDAGTSWKNITGSLPDVPANSAAFLPGGTIIVGTDIGVYQTTDDGATWQAGPTGLPAIIVTDLLYLPAINTLIAGTHGRGMWAFSFGTPATVLRGDVNGDGKVDAADALLIQQALVNIPLPTGVTMMPNGDANCNGVLESADVLAVLRAAVGLPAASACVGTVK
jgi:photosystem II stability/assembly factor-like uncharacterized protein